jgi:predicted molibdopterin-dependent oxidoreductase YjgC
MTDVYTLTIDGKDVAGTAGQTVMEVAEENGIDIPGSAISRASATAGPAACAWSRSPALPEWPRPA